VNRTATPQNFYDLESEYGVGIIDTPHRVVLAPMINLPGPAEGGLKHLFFGNWMVSAMAEFVTGPPIAAYGSTNSEANLGLFGGLQRLNPTDAPVETSGSQADRVASADHPTAAWVSRDAYADPGVGMYGTLSRLDARGRMPFRRNIDLVVTKGVSVATGQRVEIRFEFINLTDNPVLGGAGTNYQAADFGRITVTRGFPRLTQLTVRYTF
jgi:hypothetical protein